MNLFQFPIKRPVTIAMGMIMMVVLGLLSLSRMPLDLMPEISFPNLVVYIGYDGAGPEQVEERVGKPVEAVIKAVSNVKNVKVTAQEEMCFINAEFNWGTDLDSASADIREKIAMVREVLPEDIDEPVVLRIDLQDFPVLFLNIHDPTGKRNLADLADLSKDVIAPQLERLPGVASAATLGGLTREIQVNLDKEKMERYGLDYLNVMNAIRYQNLNLTTGDVDFSAYNFRIRGMSEFESLEELGEIVVGNGMTQMDMQAMQSGKLVQALTGSRDNLAGQGAISPIKLKDVADIVDTFKEKRGIVRIVDFHDGPSEGIGMAVLKETDANMVQVARKVIAQLDDIEATLPAGVKVAVSFDLSEIITDSITALRGSAIEGGIMAAVVIFVFLWRVRPSIIIITSIPLSLLTAFIAMYFSDYTLNIMTLGGMVIAVGKLVDDSIVVLENIYRHLSQGEDPFTAAEKGFREVATAVVSATLVAVIIFLPVAFTEGLSAQLFKTFAGTIFFALMGSLVVAFTVVPMLSSRLLKPEPEEKRAKSGRFFGPISNGYGAVVAWAIDHWYLTLVLAAVVLALTGAMTFHMVALGKYEFIPRLVGGLYRATIKLPPGVVLAETDAVMKKIESDLQKLPDYHHFFVVVGESGDRERAAFMGGEQGTNRAEMNIKMLKEAEGRKTSDKELRDMWDRFGKENPNVEMSFQQAGSLDFSSEKPIQVKIYGDDFKILKQISDRIAARVKTVPGTRDVTTTMEEGVPEFRYSFDRDRLSAFGLATGQVLTEVKAAVDGELASLYREAGDEHDITIQLREDQRDTFDEIEEITVMSAMGFPVKLRDVANFEYSEGPSKIERENSARLVKVASNKTDDRDLGQIVEDIRKILDEEIRPTLPEGYLVEFGGEIEDLKDAFIDLAMMFAASILLVYLILASLYESVIHPITIMVAIPLAFTGAVAGLYITDTAFGVTAFIGLIMLVGIVATNSIVLMDFIIEFHRQGMDRREAIIEAGKTRLRPILMTAFTTLFGVLPIAMGRAEGLELQKPLGIVVVGGLISSTALTLIVIPVFYQIFDDFALDMKKLFRRKTKTETPPPIPTGKTGENKS